MKQGWGEASKHQGHARGCPEPPEARKTQGRHSLTVTLVFLGFSSSETANNNSPLLGAMEVTKALALHCGVLRSQSRDHLWSPPSSLQDPLLPLLSRVLASQTDTLHNVLHILPKPPSTETGPSLPLLLISHRLFIYSNMMTVVCCSLSPGTA